jgi:thiol-disulfide isomerase/thioredoxin
MKMTGVCGIFVLLAIPRLLTAADAPASPAVKLEAIKKAAKDAEEAYGNAARSLSEGAEGEKKAAELWQTFSKKQTEGFEAAIALAKSDPTSSVAFDALDWVLTVPRSYYVPAGIRALRELTEHHADNPNIGRIAATCGKFGPGENDKERYAATDAFFKAILEKNPNRLARGQVLMSLAWRAEQRFAVAEYKQLPQAETLAAEADKAFEEVIKDYSDCPLLVNKSTSTLGDIAKRAQYAVRNLRVGKAAPEIINHDLTDKEVRLSSLRGKVVVLDIWTTWCGPCRQMIPHEREMVERLKDKPFALVSISADETKEALTKFLQKESMPWTHWWNGSKAGMIKDWNVTYFPTIYVLDAKGVIRFKDIRGKQLEDAVNQLLKDREEASKTQ